MQNKRARNKTIFNTDIIHMYKISNNTFHQFLKVFLLKIQKYQHGRITFKTNWSTF